MKKLVAIISFTCFALVIGCNRSAPSSLSPTTIEHDYQTQIDRANFYAQNFTKFLKGPLEFPPKGSEPLDRSLFQIPEILDFSLLDEAAKTGIHAEAWTHDSLVKSQFWFTNDSPSAAASLVTGTGTTKSGREVNIAIYRATMIEKDTGKQLRCEFAFDLDALKNRQNKP
jgi:hypothetical protein